LYSRNEEVRPAPESVSLSFRNPKTSSKRSKVSTRRGYTHAETSRPKWTPQVSKFAVDCTLGSRYVSRTMRPVPEWTRRTCAIFAKYECSPHRMPIPAKVKLISRTRNHVPAWQLEIQQAARHMGANLCPLSCEW